MINMRIDIIRKELERRYKEVEKLQRAATDDQVKEACNRFLHFLLTEPFIKPFILELSNFNEKFVQSNQFEPIKVNVIKAVKGIISEINRAGLVDDELRKKLQQQYGEEIDHPFVSSRSCSYPDEYIQELAKIEQYSDLLIYNLDEINDRLVDIIELADSLKKTYNRDNTREFTRILFECKEGMIAYVRVKADYDGAISLNDLLLYYLISPYRILSGVRSDEFGGGVTKAVPAAEIAGPLIDPETIDHCRNVYHAVDKFLSTSKSKSFLIDRLLTYCRWIKREDFLNPRDKNRELKVSKIVEEFLFNHGYFPLVDPKVGTSVPDILSVPGINVRWDNSVLIELKQSIGTCYTDGELLDNITQAKQYLSSVRGAKPDIIDRVYLLVFYDEDYLLEVDKSYRDKCEEDNVYIELIYVGKQSPSKLTKTKILKEHNTTAKKKTLEKKVSRKSSRRK